MKITFRRKSRSPIRDRQLLVSSPVYPKAVPDCLLMDEGSDDDRAVRAFMIFEALMPPDLAGKSFFDFGGDHFILTEAARRGMHFEPPHDLILLYDLLDHEVATSPVYMLQTARSRLKTDGMLVVRCHPWCSRHATHVYRQNNKAYLHLLFSDQELGQMGIIGKPTIRDTVPPSQVYRQWFKEAGLNVIYEEVVRDAVEPLFSQRQVLELMAIENKSLIGIQFVDYVLTHA